MRALYPLFFVSGFPALLYQMVWQRSLFAVFGTNIESVTAVVAAFMLGLGLGGLLGGRLSLLPTHRLLFAFGLIEAAIGITGLISLPIFHAVGANLSTLSVWQTGPLAFLLVSIPTTLMGATLPILTAYFTRRSRNVGRSVGALYLVNALGSAVACFVAGAWMMHALGQQGTVLVAASLNLLVAAGSLILAWRGRHAVDAQAVAAETADSASRSAPIAAAAPAPLFSKWFAWSLAMGAGFISLSLEILWLRAYSFVSGSFAPVTTYVIGAYLIGIAFGSWIAEKLAERWAPGDAKLTRAVFFIIIGACVFSFLLPPLLSFGAVHIDHMRLIVLVVPGAALWGALLPLLAHVAIRPDDSAGEGLGGIYAANIVGAVLGTLLTGFVWMDLASTATISLSLALIGLSMGWLWVALRAGSTFKMGSMIGQGAVLAVIGLAMAMSSQTLFDGFYERLLYKADYKADQHFAVEVENRSGIVHITEEGTVYGGGAYDGKVNTKLANDINGVHRAFAVSAFHPAPKRVLMVGLASGSWARIIADHPQVESLHVVEINKGYLSAIDKYPEVADVVSHPKVRITIDDGRRFIRALGKENPEQKYDLIIMNTTWHWRAYASTILSVDFLRLTKTVLAPGGMIFYNATYAPEVHRTALEAFPASLRYSNMVLASDSPINIDLDRWERVLREYRMRGEPVLQFDTPEHQTLLAQARQRFLTVEGDEWDTLEPREHIVKRTAGRRVITDDNMGTEWQGK